jgi:UDP-N-acetylmuramyl-tripeptide synthetase
MAADSFGVVKVNLKITGLFNILNTLAAVGVALAENIDLKTICLAIENFSGVSGRFELIDQGQSFTVIVDYAHTPDGMENVFKAAQGFVRGKIICVFGCGGDRDKTKRPVMGRLAVKYADIILVTSDNPRTEDPLLILKDIESGIKEGLSLDNSPNAKHYEIIPDRKKAIEQAITLAKNDDAVLILGKGHETYQILKDKTIHFDDREIAGDQICRTLQRRVE